MEQQAGPCRHSRLFWQGAASHNSLVQLQCNAMRGAIPGQSLHGAGLHLLAGRGAGVAARPCLCAQG